MRATWHKEHSDINDLRGDSQLYKLIVMGAA